MGTIAPLDPARIARENRARFGQLFREAYDPTRGIGCYGDRFALASTDHVSLMLPERMLGDDSARAFVDAVQQAGSIERVKSHFELEDGEFRSWLVELMRQRFRFDPEAWFEACVKIKTKRSGVVPFVPRPAQRLLLKSLLDQYWAGEPVRVLLVKARQWGGSTLVQLLIAWIQQFQRKGWNAMIVGDVQQQAAHIRGMYTTLARQYPSEFGQIAMRPYEGMQNVRWLEERGCILGIGSAERPNSLRSFTTHLLHLSEVGLWKSTQEKSAEDLVQALEGGLVDGAGTMCVKESTAKGTGNYFHREYEANKKGEGGYENVFVGWWQIEDYTLPVPDAEFGAFVRSWSEYERSLWDLGATVEGIRWYRKKHRSLPAEGRDMRMREEYPSTAEEAFQASGRPVFPPEYVARARLSVREPIRRGHLVADSLKGEGALTNIRFVDDPEGALMVWRMPGDDLGGMLDLNGFRMINRYCGFLDLGARWHGGDWHVGPIIDRARILLGDGPEKVAQWRTHLDQDLAGWEMARLCAWYENALMAVEKNSLKRRQADGTLAPAAGYLTVLDEIREYYDNLFYTVDVDATTQEKVQKLGFATTAASKQMIIDGLTAASRDGTYTERDGLTCDEMAYFEVKPDGTQGAREGQHDDCVMSTSGAVWLASSYMDPPRLVSVSSFKPRNKPGGAASF